MNLKQTLALYDEEQRRTIEYPGLRREATPNVVRHVDLLGTDGVVVYSRLDAKSADGVIREQIAYYKELGHDFEWKHYDHDTPADLKARLAGAGFQIEELEAILVLDLENLPPKLLNPVAHDIRQITDPKQIDEVMIVQNEIWQSNEDSLARRQIVYEMEHTPEALSVYVVYVDDKPVASSWIRVPESTQFASLWAGATLSQYRRRGIYNAMLAVRAKEAQWRGKRFLSVDAGPMSRPILERLGFQLLSLSTPCQWKGQYRER